MSLTVRGIPALQRRLKAVQKAASTDLLGRIQDKTARYAKHRVPKKTGHLSQTIRPGYLTRSYAIVHAHAGYAAYVEFGTKEHDIKPRNKPFLAWPAQGRKVRLTGALSRSEYRKGKPKAGSYVYSWKGVHHPGTKPQPYLVPGAKQAVSEEVGREPIIAAWNGAA